jgi:putative OPT family oligopeptide transporter
VSQVAENPAPSAPAAPEFTPFVSPEAEVREWSWRGVILGCALGIVFAASSVYLGLKVGLTVSASIPVAVLAITVFRWLERAFGLKRATILENNIVQTTGSAGESIAAGVAFTLPSLLLMGFPMETARTLLVALLGGLIGVLMMVPLRHGLIVKEHGKLTYPEGTACAEVLIVGERGGTSARTVFSGFFVGFGYSVLMLILKLWSEVSTFAIDFWGRLKGATISFEVSPTMLGVGYIIGPRTAANMMAGGLLAFVVLIPLVHLFGDSMSEPMYPATKTIAAMDPGEIRDNFVLYIGAGAVATGGFIALARSVPSILSAFAGAMRSLRGGRGSPAAKRTERDLPMHTVVGASLGLAVAIWLAPTLGINLISALLLVLFGFFFVTVSSRITGEIGSSSNPISGMTVATLLITCGIFVLLGWTGVGYKAMALTTAALVCVAASNGGTISQDLKTGFLVGATPRAQQTSILFGVVTSAVVIGFTLLLLNEGSTTYQAVSHPEYRPALPADAERKAGPDGKEYRLLYLPEEAPAAGVARGKYLVRDDGTLAFLVDPGVCGTYPWRLQEPPAVGALLAVPPEAPVELGPDHEPYRVVELKEAQGELPAGRYLVGEDGKVAYRAVREGKFNAPKAQLFRLIIDGTLGGRLPWGLVLVGVFLALMMELVGVSSLPFAVGLYLPISTSAGIFVGGMARWVADRARRVEAGGAHSDTSPGVLLASGLIAGGALAGVAYSVIAFTESGEDLSLSDRIGGLAHNETWWPLLPFLLMAALLAWVGIQGERRAPRAGG